MKTILATLAVALALAVATPSISFAKNGADDPAGHNAGDDRGRGGHGADNGAGHR